MTFQSLTTRLSRPVVARVSASLALALGLITLIGMVTPYDGLNGVLQGDNRIVFNSVVCILALSLGTLFRQRRHRAAATALFVVALLVASTVTLEHVLRLGSVIDDRFLHLQFIDHHIYPGRMSLNLCLAVLMLSIGGLIQSWSPGRRSAQATRLLGLLAGALGVLGLVGSELALDFLYHSIGLVQIAPIAGVMLILLSVAITLGSARSRRPRKPEDFNLNRVARVVVVAVAAITGLSSFALTQQRLESTLSNNLDERLTERASFLAAALYDYRQRAELTARPQSVAENVKNSTGEHAQASRAALFTFIHELLPAGFSAIEFTDTGGRAIARLGDFRSRRARSGLDLVPISLKNDADQLGWDQGYYMLSRRELRYNGTLVGFALGEQPLASIARLTALPDAIGSSAEVSLCSVAAVQVMCFPTSQHDRPFQLDATVDRVEATLLPRSMTEPSGMMRSTGRQGEPLLAAYRPVSGTSFVMIMTSDLSDVYAPVRNAFQSVLPLIFLLAIAGILVVQWFIRPLARQLLVARRSAEASEQRFRAAAEGSLDALFLLEAVRDPYQDVRDFKISYANSHGERMLGVSGEALSSVALSETLPLMRRSGWFTRYLRVLETGQPISGNVMIRLPGMTGSWLHQHVTPLGDGLAVTVRDISAQRATEDKLRHAAQTDSLTGLPNRALLLDRIERSLLRAVRQPNAIALLYLDLDGFKGINDHYGHAAGDAVLIEFARRLNKAVRAEDTVARLGGDEFCILVENLSGRAEAFRIADALLLSARVPISTPGQTLRITTSIGIAFGQAGEDSAARFLARADSALYQVKRRGRNGYFGEEAPEAPLAAGPAPAGMPLLPPGLAGA